MTLHTKTAIHFAGVVAGAKFKVFKVHKQTENQKEKEKETENKENKEQLPGNLIVGEEFHFIGDTQGTEIKEGMFLVVCVKG